MFFKTNQWKKEEVMKKESLVVFTGVIIIIFALTLFLPGRSQAGTIKLKYASFMPPVHKQSLLSKQWCKELEKRTNGRVKVTYLPGSTLVPAPQGYEAAVRGITDISISAPAWTAGRFPLSEVLDLPLGYKDGLQATLLANEFYKKFKPKEYDDAKILYFWSVAPGVFMTLKPVPTIEGLKGLKMRAGGNQAKIARAMGVTPVSVPIADIYEGLQRAVIDGIVFYPEGLKGWKYADLIRGLQVNPGINYAGACVFAMNKKKWDSLPPDIQDIIEKMNEEWIPKTGEIWTELSKEGIEFGISKGMKVFNISPEEQKKSVEMMKPIFAAYVADMKSKGLPGEEALKFCREWLEAHP
jgi:TRAP-type transport system periplasmic protein